MKEKNIHAEETAGIDEKRLYSVIKLNQQKTSSLKDLLDLALTEAINLTDSQFGYIYFYNEGEKKFTLHAWSTEVMKQCEINDPPTIYELEETGIWGEVVRQRSAIVINDFQAYNPLKKGYPTGHAPLFRFMSLPVIMDDQIVAVIGVANKALEYSETDVWQLNLMMEAIWNIAERFKADEMLKKSEAKFCKLFQSSPAAMLITRLSDRHIIELNQAFVKLSGFSQQEVIGHRALDLGIYADLRDREHIIKTTLTEGKLDNYDFRFNAKGNKSLFCRISTELIQIEEPCMLSTITDLTEIKHVEEALRESETKFKGIYENSYDAIMLIKGDTYIDCNPQSLELFGIESREKFMELGPAQLSPPIQPDGEDTSTAVKNRLKIAMEKGSNHFEWMHRRSNDEDFYAEVRLASFNIGDEKVIQATVRDISELKRVETEIRALNEELEQRVIQRTIELEQANKDLLGHSVQLKESTQRLRMLFQAIDASPISVVITDWKKNIIYANSHAANVTGYSLDELLGKNPRILKSGQHPEEFYNRMWATLDSGKQWKGEICNKKKNGELFWESSSISPVFGTIGKVTNYIAVKEDITEQRQMIQEMEIARSAAESANRAKSTFLANMSHEIRTPMNSILGYTQLMQLDLSLNSDQREYINIINQSGEHLLSLINDILEMSKIESGKVALNLEHFSLIDLLDDCAKMFMISLIQKDLRLTIDPICPMPSNIFTDCQKVRQVVINIIGNAIKFTEKGGIDIRVFFINNQKEDQLHLAIEVEDTGCGIAPEEIGRVFDVFEQTQSGRRQGSSTGLGMTISRYYARLMGGDLTVTSRLGEGSIFRFTFIAQNSCYQTFPEKKTSPQRAVIGLGPGKPSPKILVVDDLTTNRTLLRMILEKVGFSVQEAGNGLEAIFLCKQWKPDVILMDVRMPEMNGFEATRLLKSTPESNHIGVFIITASALESDRFEALISGADGFIRKPYKESEILEELQRFLDLEYKYGDAMRESSNTIAFEGSHLLVAQVPVWVVDRIIGAVAFGDSIVLKELIAKEVMLCSPILGQRLLELANNYNYREIEEILKKG